MVICYACTVEQLIFKDLKFWGLSKIYFKTEHSWKILEDEQEVGNWTSQSCSFKDRYFWGFVNIHKAFKIFILKINYPTVHEYLYLCWIHHRAISTTSAVCKQGVIVIQICVIILTVLDVEDQRKCTWWWNYISLIIS